MATQNDGSRRDAVTSPLQVGERFTPDCITSLKHDEIFVFGSNAAGRHCAGAAGLAVELFGAEDGQAEGLQGQSYAIPSMEGLDNLRAAVARFLEYARATPGKTFLVTRVGCGIAGHTPADVAPFFAGHPANVILPQAFAALLVDAPQPEAVTTKIECARCGDTGVIANDGVRGPCPCKPAPADLTAWYRQMAEKEQGQYVGAGQHGIPDVPQQLLPCPFCGGKPKAMWHFDIPVEGLADGAFFRIDCCRAFACADDESAAAEAWNTRALPSQPATAPEGWVMVPTKEIAKALMRARVFDDGSDGADAESAQSVVAILSPMLAAAPSPDHSAGAGKMVTEAQAGVDDAVCPNCERVTGIRHCQACGCDFTQAKPAEGGAVVALTGKYGAVLRPFVAMMDAELHANAGKGDRPGWLAMSADTCLLEIYYHVAKLQKAVRKDQGNAICEHAADVANMAMMLVDICGGLNDEH